MCFKSDHGWLKATRLLQQLGHSDWTNSIMQGDICSSLEEKAPSLEMWRVHARSDAAAAILLPRVQRAGLSYRKTELET